MQIRIQHSDGLSRPPLVVELWICSAPDYSEGTLKLHRTRVKPILSSASSDSSDVPLLLSLVNECEYISQEGVTFGALFSRILDICATNRLQVLQSRLLKTKAVDAYIQKVTNQPTN